MRKFRVFQENAYLSLDYQNQSGEIYRLTNGQIVRESVEVEKDEANLRSARTRGIENAVQIAMEVSGVIESRDIVGNGELHDAIVLLFELQRPAPHP